MIIKFKLFEQLEELDDPFGEEVQYDIHSMDDYWEMINNIPYLKWKKHVIDDFDYISFAIDYPNKEIVVFEIWPSDNIGVKKLFHLNSNAYEILTECTEKELMDKISLLIENN